MSAGVIRDAVPVAEPVLTADDIERWAYWRKVALVHAGSRSFQRKVSSAKDAVTRWLDQCERPCVSWSAGKDSTCMTHLVCVEMGHRDRVVALSEKDDLDYPGEEQYVVDTAAAWGLRLQIVRPPVSPWGWLLANRQALGAGSEMHARSAGLSKACFYGVMEDADRPFDGVALGLRSEESAIRRRVRQTRGRVFKVASGQVRCLPVADWTGLDVFAYVHSREIDLLHVYKCLALMHSNEPWLIRKSWWIPGSHASNGGVVWLQRYYPSLYAKLCGLFGDAWQYTA